MNTEQNKVNLDANQRQEIKDAAVVDLQHDTNLRADMLTLLATPYNPATGAPNVHDFLVRFDSVRVLIDGWVAAVYPDPQEANLARAAIFNEAIAPIKEVITEHRGTYENKHNEFETSVNNLVNTLRTFRTETMQRWSTINAGGGAIPGAATAAYTALIAALDITRDQFMGNSPLSSGVTVADYNDINIHILTPTTAAINNFMADLSGYNPAAGSPELAAKNQILAANIDFSQFSHAARESLRDHRGNDANIDFIMSSSDYLTRLNDRLVKPALNVVADQATRYRHLQFNATNNTGHGNANYPYAAMLPVTNPLTQSGFAAGPLQASDGDINRYYGWALENKGSLSEDATNAVDACATNTLEYHVDFTQIQNELNTIAALRGVAGQLRPSVIRSLGPAAVEAYVSNYAYYVDGAQGFAGNDAARDARLKLLAWHFGIAPGQNMTREVYAKITETLIENLGHVTDKSERKEITDETMDDYAKFYKGRFLRSGLRQNARREVFSARKEEIYANLADEYEGKQISSVELQKKLKADLVKEIMRGRFEMIEKLASKREASEDAGMWERFGSKVEGMRRKFAANPAKRFLANIAVGGSAVAAGAFIPMLPFSAGALALSGLVGLSARGATMSMMDGARAKLSNANGSRAAKNTGAGRRNAATGVRGAAAVRPSRHAQTSLIKQISLAHDVNGEFDLNKKTGEFSIQSDTYQGQLDRSTALWKAESLNVESVVEAQIRAATAAGSNLNPMDVIVNSMEALYGNGGLEDTFMKRLEKEMINRRTFLNINQASALGMAFTGATLFTVGI
jgi:hypothetical protein